MHFFVDKWAFMYDWWYTFTTFTLVLHTFILKSHPPSLVCLIAPCFRSARVGLLNICVVSWDICISSSFLIRTLPIRMYSTSFPHYQTASPLSRSFHAATHPHLRNTHANRRQSENMTLVYVRYGKPSQMKTKEKRGNCWWTDKHAT